MICVIGSMRQVWSGLPRSLYLDICTFIHYVGHYIAKVHWREEESQVGRLTSSKTLPTLAEIRRTRTLLGVSSEVAARSAIVSWSWLNSDEENRTLFGNTQDSEYLLNHCFYCTDFLASTRPFLWLCTHLFCITVTRKLWELSRNLIILSKTNRFQQRGALCGKY